MASSPIFDGPLISIVVPLYNQQRNIRRCLRSILRQTYQNLEILVVNDGRSDKSLEIVQRLASADERLLVFSQDNNGVAAARKCGYLNAHGEWLVFVDSDDYLPLDSLNSLYCAAVLHRVDIVCGDHYRKIGFVKKASRAFPRNMAMTVLRQPELFTSYYLSFFGVNLFPVTMYGKIYRKSLLDQAMSHVDLFLTPRLHMGEDEAFNLQLFPYVTSVFCLEKSIYVYRFGGITSGYNPYLVELLDFSDYRIAFLDQYQYNEGYPTLFIEYVNILISHIQQSLLFQNWNKDDAKKWLQKELDNRYLVCRMSDYYSFKTEIPDKCRIALNRELERIINLAEERLKQRRLRTIGKKILARICHV